MALRTAFIVGIILGLVAGVKCARAGDLYASGMLGAFTSAGEPISQVKMVNLGFRRETGCGLSMGLEAGAWSVAEAQERSFSVYTSPMIGVTEDGALLARAMVGPALISKPDSRLSGVLQFTEQAFIGLKGTNGNVLGFKYQHFSNAGLKQPNMGRDFLGLEASIPF